MIPLRPEPNDGGYVSPHGYLEGLRERLQRWRDQLGRDRTLPWVGLGLVEDLEIVVQLLNLREFGEWLRVNGGENARFGDEIVAVSTALRAAGYAGGPMAANVRDLDAESRRNERLATIAADAHDDVRAVLIEIGALAEGDNETRVPDLLRALLA